MNPLILQVRADDFTDRQIQPAAKALLSGGLLVFPTETVYGLGTNPRYQLAVHRLYRVKKRPRNMALTLHVASVEQVYEYVAEFPPAAMALAEAFWPGPLTLVLQRADDLDPDVVGGKDTVGVRLPDHPVARRIAELAGVPIAGTSANLSGEPSPVTIDEAMWDLQEHVDVFVDSGTASRRVESAVLDLTTQPHRLLRPGQISKTEIEEVLMSAGLPARVIESGPEAAVGESGSTPMRIVVVRGRPRQSLSRAEEEARTENSRGGSARILIPVGLSQRPDVQEYIRNVKSEFGIDSISSGVSELNLYSTLRELEDKGATLILVPYSSEARDSLVMDRIVRRARYFVENQ